MTLLFERGEAVYDRPQEKGARYRYRLRRHFPTGTGRVCFVMLNPSTATAEVSDPTVRRCEGYAVRWGYRILEVVNIFALRSTNPKALYRAIDPVGPDNDAHLVDAVRSADLAIAAWGVHAAHMNRHAAVKALLTPYAVHCLLRTRDDYPSHPLYLKADLVPQPFIVNGRTGPLDTRRFRKAAVDE